MKRKSIKGHFCPDEEGICVGCNVDIVSLMEPLPSSLRLYLLYLVQFKINKG